MAAVTVRRLSPETHRALKVRAKRHGRSTEAEIRAILEAAVSEQPTPRIGSALASLGRRFRGVEIDVERDPTPAAPLRLE
jgi:plasmid stability protein